MAYNMNLDIGPSSARGEWTTGGGGRSGIPPELAEMLRWQMGKGKDLHKMKLKELAKRLEMMDLDLIKRRRNEQRLEPQESLHQIDPSRDEESRRLARSADYVKAFSGDMGMPAGGPDVAARMIASMGGPETANKGMMQSGRILGQLGATALDKAPKIERPEEEGGRGWGLGGRAFSQMRQMFGGAGSGRKHGGGIPETGYYKLHEGEHVVPAPETMKDMMVDRMKGKSPKKNKPGEYQQGTEDIKSPGEILKLITYALGGLDPSVPGEEADPTEAAMGVQGTGPLERFSQEEGRAGIEENLPEAMEEFMAMGAPDLPEEAPEMSEGFAGEDEMPDIGMYTGEELGAPPYMTEMEPISERRESPEFGTFTRPETEQTEVPKYTMRGAPEPDSSPEDEIEERFEQEQKEIDDMRSAASQELRYANELARYARERPNSPAADNLVAMASERADAWKKMNAEAKQLQEDKDGRMQAAGSQLAQVTTARIMAGGQAARGQAQAQGQMAAAGQRGEQGRMDMIQSIAVALAKIIADQGGDPEQAQEFLQSLLTSMWTGQAMGGGFPGEQ